MRQPGLLFGKRSRGLDQKTQAVNSKGILKKIRIFSEGQSTGADQGVLESIQIERLKQSEENFEEEADKGYEQWNHLKSASTRLKCESGNVLGQAMKEFEKFSQIKTVLFWSF